MELTLWCESVTQIRKDFSQGWQHIKYTHKACQLIQKLNNVNFYRVIRKDFETLNAKC